MFMSIVIKNHWLASSLAKPPVVQYNFLFTGGGLILTAGFIGMLLSESEMILSGHFFILKSKNYVNDK
jgi:hypothetical protein